METIGWILVVLAALLVIIAAFVAIRVSRLKGHFDAIELRLLEGEGSRREQLQKISQEAAYVRREFKRSTDQIEKHLEELVIEAEKNNYLSNEKGDLASRTGIDKDPYMRDFKHRKLRAQGCTDEDISELERSIERRLEINRKLKQKAAESDDKEREV